MNSQKGKKTSVHHKFNKQASSYLHIIQNHETLFLPDKKKNPNNLTSSKPGNRLRIEERRKKNIPQQQSNVVITIKVINN